VHVFPLSPSSVADYSDAHHDYPAVDIFCPIGTEVVAVTDGIVDFVSRVDTWDPATDDPAVRGGISVAVVGDDGVRYYGSHLSSIAPSVEPGVRVRAGQRLGASGRTGNARDTDPHLHFGISHPTTADDWAVRRGEVDPFPYLEAWRRGEDVTPEVP
jgi:murein DD-endopeptidase MepM/ murein hydrolase activator NlpD